MHDQPERGQSFGTWAEDYDRFRAGYPRALAVDLIAGGRRTVLDLACGTGKAALALAEVGGEVLGVEPDARMAAIAERAGVPVEVARFEEWDARARRFDIITCASAWHWLSPEQTLPRIPELLNPGGLLARFWNIHVLDDTTLALFDRVYDDFPVELDRIGHDPGDRHEPPDPVREAPGMVVLPTRTYLWEDTITTDAWLGRIGTYTSHQRLGPDKLAELKSRVRAAIEALGGSITAQMRTICLLARRT